MAGPTTFQFSYKELAAILVREAKVAEGYWGIRLVFGLGGGNIGIGADQGELVPAAVVTIREIGLQKFDEQSNLTVDAAEISKGR